MPRTFAEKVDPAKAALLVIDMQNDFCHENGRSATLARVPFDPVHVQSVVPNLQKLLASAREVGTPIVFLRFALSDDTVAENFKERLPGDAYPCPEGTWGADWYGVGPEEGDLIVTKHRFSSFIGTNLDEILRTKGVESLILTGTRTNVCVQSTAWDGFQHDYWVVVLSDCTAASGDDDHQAALDRLRNMFAEVVTSDQVMAKWTELRLLSVKA
jgi:ureidoacrylate peracid hydrolase